MMASDSIQLSDIQGFIFIDGPISGAAKEALFPFPVGYFGSAAQHRIVLQNLVELLNSAVANFYGWPKQATAKSLDVIGNQCGMSPETVAYLLDVVVKARHHYCSTQEQGPATHKDPIPADLEASLGRDLALNADILRSHPAAKDLYGKNPFDLETDGAKKRKATDNDAFDAAQAYKEWRIKRMREMVALINANGLDVEPSTLTQLDMIQQMIVDAIRLDRLAKASKRTKREEKPVANDNGNDDDNTTALAASNAQGV